jgi:hypothetical protein
MLKQNILYDKYSELRDQKAKQTIRSVKKLRYFVGVVASVTFWLSCCSIGYCYTMEDVDLAVANATTDLCSAEQEQYISNNQIGFNIYQICLQPKNVMAVINIGLGNDCMNGYGDHYNGATIGFGCNGQRVYWAAACDNTSNRVPITATTPVYRTCYLWTAKVYCDGTESTPSGSYIDLGMDCTAMITSPCVSIKNSEDNCFKKTLFTTIYPVCDGSDPCCGSQDPCCPQVSAGQSGVGGP